jgi:hypothetical protein
VWDAAMLTVPDYSTAAAAAVLGAECVHFCITLYILIDNLTSLI